jgi:hypothetical protein
MLLAALKKITVRMLVFGGVVFPALGVGNGVLAVETRSLPVIERFEANPIPAVTGEFVTLSWKATGANYVFVEHPGKNDEGSLGPEDSLVYLAEETGTATLTAYGPDGKSVSKSIVVTVNHSGPVIESFESSPNPIVLGDTTRISWKVRDAVRIEIDGFIKDCDCERPLEGSDLAAPETTTTFTLRAYGTGGEVSTATTTVTVLDKTPIIDTFKASKLLIPKGQLVVLTWKTRNASKWMLLLDSGLKLPLRSPQGRIGVTPNKTTTYTLVASDAKGHEVRKSITVVVKK